MKDFYLGPNHGTEAANNIICVDTETWTHNPDHIQRLRLGHAIYIEYDKRRDAWDETAKKFRTTTEFHDWLETIFSRFKKTGKRVWLISHNMAYDFPVLEMDKYLSFNGWETPKLWVPGTPFLYYTSRKTFEKKKLDLRIISSTNWYNWPLKKLAPIFSTNKIVLSDPDFDKITDDELEPYCEQDTRIVVDIAKNRIKIIKDKDLGTMQSTIASQAFSAFRHRFMPRDVPLLVHHRPNLIKLELDSYKGGRTEAFQLGNVDDMYILDVNSLYPTVMHHNWYPVVPKCKSPIEVNSEYVPESFSEDFLIANCNISLKEPCIGIHRQDDHKLVFPIGNINTVLTSPEILYIQEHPEMGTVEFFNQIAAYEQSTKLFTAYVDFFYDMKKNAINPIEFQEAKNYLTNLYGKFGQRLHDNIEEAGAIDIAIIQSMQENNISVIYDKDKTYIRTGNRILVKPKGPGGQVSTNSMPRIASAVTAYGRMLLWDIINTVGLENVNYCDTDSIVTDQEGLSKCIKEGMCDESRLGGLKWEGPFSYEFLSPKHYITNKYHTKSKGIRKNAKWIAPNKDHPEGGWEQDSFKTGMSRYKEGIIDGVKVERIIKTCKDINDKGTVTKTGRVEPLVFHDF